MASDAVAVAAALVAVTGLGSGATEISALSGLVIVAMWLLAFQLYGLYPRRPRFVAASLLNELPQRLHATGVALASSGAWLAATGAAHPRPTLTALLLGGVFAVPAARTVAGRMLSRGIGPEHVLLVGSGSIADGIGRSLESRRDVIVAGCEPLPAEWSCDAAASGDRRSLTAAVRDGRVDRVLLSTRDLRDASLPDFHAWAISAGVSLTVLPEHFEIAGSGAKIDHVQGVPVVSLQPPELSSAARLLKRVLDVAGAAAGLILLAPLAVAVMVAIKVDSRGPVFFRQQRIGRGNVHFGVFKFRTMVPDADAMVEDLMVRSTDPHWLQLDDDPRVTRVGRVLRSSSLDELPQLLNVLLGHMSLVGPRPLSVLDDARVRGWGRGRLDLTPGLTGLWQVLGRKSVPFEQMVKLDHLYVNNWSLWGDAKLLLQTLPAVISGHGAR